MCAGLILNLVSSPALAWCWEEAGKRYNVDPFLLYVIAEQESTFNPKAISTDWDGSQGLGLMQINTKHLKTLSKYGIEREHLFDPCTSVMLGAWLLADNRYRYGNSWDTIGGYNAGFRRTDKQESRRMKYARQIYERYKKALQRARNNG